MMKYLILLLVGIALAACSSSATNVQGIGSGRNDYKESPCACGPKITVPNNRSLT